MELLKKYSLEGHDARFYYQFLDRLKSDCKYYLGNGNRRKKYLWAQDEQEQIALMREVYAILPEPPEWLTPGDIEQLEKQMTAQGVD